MDIKLSIIILSWNTPKLLKECLESILADRYLVLGDRPADGYEVLGDGPRAEKTTANTQPLSPITEIIIVDNGSTDGSVDLVKSLKLKVKNCSSKLEIKLIENKENVGFAKANNQGIKAARGEYIMLLNSDTIVKENAIGKLVNYLDEHPDIDIIGPKLLNSDGTTQASCGKFPTLPVVFVMLFKEHFGGSDYVRGFLKESDLVDWMMGAAFIARREVFEKVGGLDEKIFMYMEEVDWFYRAKKENFNAYYLKDAEIVHLGMGSSKSGRKEPIVHIYEGLLLYYRKHHSKTELIILEILLKIKAFTALIIGWIKHDNYLIETYGQAIKIH